ncbi:MAG: ABC transporter substrate-binding protein, partial [Planococcaceae bacterium]|nr:ABC transporter substrate-binding protein [Planococcaceae bacterium]
MRKNKSWLLALLVMLVLSTILAACSSDSSDGDSGDKSDPKILVFGRGGDSVSLDPAAVTDGESFKVTQNLFETLVNFGAQDTTINPGLAKE